MIFLRANNVLHDCKVALVRLVREGKPEQTAVMRETNVDGADVEYFEFDENLFRPRMVGFMAGEDARDIYGTAIDWWQAELTKIVS